MQAYLDFNRLLNGDYKRRRDHGPMAAYDGRRGATVRTSDFADKNLDLSMCSNVVSFLSSIVYSARNQKDFVNKKLVNMTLPFSMREIKAIESITLSGIIISTKEIVITLRDKAVYKREIEPLESRTKNHDEYLPPESIEEIISVTVPKLPTYEDVIESLEENNLDKELIINEIKAATNNAYSLWR